MIAAEEKPNPPRYWWLKRLSLALLVLLLTVTALRIWWGIAMNRRLAAAVAAARAQGDPITVEDLRTAPVDPQDNRAIYLQKAMEAWPRIDGKLVGDIDWGGDPERDADPVTDNAAYLRDCQPAINLLRQARDAPGCDWHIPLQSPLISTAYFFQHYASMRKLARSLGDAGERAHRVGDDRLALELIDHLLTISRAVDQPPQFLIGHLVGLSIRAIALDEIEKMQPTLAVTATDPSRPTPRQVLALIQRLLDEKAEHAAWLGSMASEQVAMHDAATAVIDGRLPLSVALGGAGLTWCDWRVTRLVLGPTLTHDAALLLETQEAAITTARHADGFHDFDCISDVREAQLKGRNWEGWLHPLLMAFYPGSLGSALQAHYQAVAQRRMAAVALAIRLYELQHGRRPATLDELVPMYLVAVPRDPWSADGRALGYCPAGGKPKIRVVPGGAARDAPAERRPAILYSVGRDGVDGGGMVFFEADGTVSFYERFREAADQFFLLEPAPQKAAPATSPKP